VYKAIKKIINTNILSRIFENSFFEKKEKPINQDRDKNEQRNDDANSDFRFENITVSSSNMTHLLYRSVIYDSRCRDLLTYNKSRFIDEIKSADD
jgi:hypothetical protein